MSERDAQPSSPIGWKLGLLVIVIGIGIFAWLRLAPAPIGPGPIPPGGTADSPVDPLRAIALKNEAIALMENGQYEEAVERFAELEPLAVGDLMVRKNRAIAALLAVSPEALDKVRYPEKYQTGFARAADLVTELQSGVGSFAIGHLLAARLAEQRDDRLKTIEELEAAVKLVQGDPALEVEVYLASRISDDKDLQARGAAALKRAAEKANDNLWILTELAIAQGMAQDADVAKTFGQLQQCCQPFVEMIKKLRNIDLREMLTKGEVAVGKGDWNTVVRNARLVSNMLKPEIATKLDQRRVVKHLLEYVVHDFSGDWYRQHRQTLSEAPTKTLSPINVSFIEAEAVDQLPPLADIRDVKIADFDLDGRWDVIVLLSGQVIVFGQPESATVGDAASNSSRWITLCEAVVPSGMKKLIACDLDRDTEETPDDHRFIGQLKEPTEKAPAGAAERAEDADIDLLVYGDDGVLFLRNVFDKATKTRSLESVSQGPAFEALRDVLAIAPADLDHDGDLDLVLSSGSGLSLWQNNDSREHTKFADISARSALSPSDLKASVLLPVDWNLDMQIDVLVTGPEVTQPGVLENISHGRFRWREAPLKRSEIGGAHSLHILNFYSWNLGWEMLAATKERILTNHVITETDPPVPTQDKLPPNAMFSSPSEARPDASQGLLLWDFNNDGHRDLLTWNDSQVSFDETTQFPADQITPKGAFAIVPYTHPIQGDHPKRNPQPLVPDQTGKVTTCCVADFDGDGDEDVLIVTDQRARWIRNDGGHKNHWIDLSIRADKDRKPQRDSERVNAHGVGSIVELLAAEQVPHSRVVEGQSTHFGLGSVQQVDAVRILWTNGVPQNVLRPKAGQPIAAQQILKGSCPYLYTWDGEKWAFFTDCLWAAPIGLQFAEGVLATPREWEYLQIDGDRLREVNGEYRLMLTEELWEAAYFDQVRLLAVDHPADVELYSNEKVGPPSIAEFKLHPVRKRHIPVAAHDHRGRDVLDKLAKRDERYLRAFDKIIQQGLAEEHFIELDLGDLSDARSATLFLTGWIFPTDTSINVSLSQNPDRDAPKPPSIWVVDEGEKGETKWRMAIPYIGFPGGKTKTIAVDLSEALGLARPDEKNLKSEISNLKSQISNLKSTRIRIVTSMELYWDEMFFTVNELDAKHTITEMPMLSADLQYRGFSARLPHPEFGPERYDAADVSTAPQWPPMGGKFTRYGDVKVLLTEADDRLAILGAGDAVTIRFHAETSRDKLPPGWKRDFILHNVGYDKDADLNTVYGQFVEPLPFRAMQGYPDSTGAEYPDSDTHRDYLSRFQTREQSRAKFWNSGGTVRGQAPQKSKMAE